VKVKIIRSCRRYKTVAGRLVNGVLELRIPAFLSAKEIEKFRRLFQQKLQAKKVVATDKFLAQRAKYLYRKFIGGKSGNLACRFSISWSVRQQKIFGICNWRKKTIRISARLKKVPRWVLDYVILHELVHLHYPHHGPKFWQLVNHYPRTERARGFLQGMEFRSTIKRQTNA